MKTKLFALCSFICALSAQAAPSTQRIYKDNADTSLLVKVKAGDVWAIKELGIRGNRQHKAVLEDVAANFKTGWEKRSDAYGKAVSKKNEAISRDAAKIILAQWGEEKYYSEFVKAVSSNDPEVKIEAMHSLAKIGNPAAVRVLVKEIDNKAVWRPARDVDNGSMGQIAADAIHALVAPELDVPGARAGEEHRLYWKKWWQENKAKYQTITFEQGRVKQ